MRTVVVCHERRTGKTVRRCYTNDGGGPLEAGVQVQVSNHLVQLCLKDKVVSDEEKVP